MTAVGRAVRLLAPLALALGVVGTATASLAQQAPSVGLPRMDGASQQAVERLDVLSAEAEKLRTTGVLDATRIGEFFAAPGARPFEVMLPGAPDRVVSNDLWSYFFRGSQIHHARLNASNPVVGYYNVFVDAWLVTRWRTAGGTAQLVGASAVLGDTMQGAASTDVQAAPRWLAEMPGRSAVAAMQAQVVAGLAAFRELHPLLAETDGVIDDPLGPVFSRSLLARRLAGFLGILAEMTAEGPVAERERRFSQAIKDGDRAALTGFAGATVGQETIDTLVHAPRQVRAGLSPILALEVGELTVVFSGAPTQARFFYFTRYSRAQDGAPAVHGVGAFDAYAQVR